MAIVLIWPNAFAFCFQPAPTVEPEELGDSGVNPPVIIVHSQPLAEGDSGSSSSSPARAESDESPGPTNLRRRRVLVETESAKRSRLEL